MEEYKGSNNLLKNIAKHLLKRKNPDDMMQVANRNGLKKTLTVFDLIILGVGAIVGTISTIVGSILSLLSFAPVKSMFEF